MIQTRRGKRGRRTGLRVTPAGDGPGVRRPELPALLRRPGGLPRRHLDDPAGDRVAGLPPRRARTPRGCSGSSASPAWPRPSSSARWPACSWTAGTGTASWSSPRCCRSSSRPPWPWVAFTAEPGTGHRLAGRRAERAPGARQRVRHAGPAGAAGRDGGPAGGPAQRHRPELVAGQRLAAGRAGAGRGRDRGRRRGVVLRHRRGQLPGRRRGPAGHAAAEAGADGRAPRRSAGTSSRACGTPSGSPPIRALLLLLALVSFATMPYSVLLPVFAADVLGGGPHTLGLLSAASGLGALAGALYLASRSSVLGLGRVIVAATARPRARRWPGSRSPGRCGCRPRCWC